MKAILRWAIVVGSASLFVLLWTAQPRRDVVRAQTHKPFNIHRFYAGRDGETHEEEVEADFSGPGGAFKMMPVTGATLHRTAPGGGPAGFHTEGQRQYVINLSGHAELEIAGGQKVAMGPGDIELVEDTTGKGHISRVTGTEDRVFLLLPLADQPQK